MRKRKCDIETLRAAGLLLQVATDFRFTKENVFAIFDSRCGKPPAKHTVSMWGRLAPYKFIDRADSVLALHIGSATMG